MKKLNIPLTILLPKFWDQILKIPWPQLSPELPTYWFVMRKHAHSGVPGPLQQEGQGLGPCSPRLRVGWHKHPVNQGRDLEARRTKVLHWEAGDPPTSSIRQSTKPHYVPDRPELCPLNLPQEQRYNYMDGLPPLKVSGRKDTWWYASGNLNLFLPLPQRSLLLRTVPNKIYQIHVCVYFHAITIQKTNSLSISKKAKTIWMHT